MEISAGAARIRILWRLCSRFGGGLRSVASKQRQVQMQKQRRNTGILHYVQDDDVLVQDDGVLVQAGDALLVSEEERQQGQRTKAIAKARERDCGAD
jgi:hypothetical protein